MRTFHIWRGWFLPLFLFCAALVFSQILHWALFKFVYKRQARAGEFAVMGIGLKRYLSNPARLIFFTTCGFIAQPFIPVSRSLHADIRQLLSLVMVITIGWFAISVVYVIQSLLYRRFDITAENNVTARRFHTQFGLFRRVVIIFIVVVTVAACAYTFHDDRFLRAGTGLLASAGLASLVLASAAKPTVGNFLAGLQIALTQPIRIDDVVIVSGEWGKIEEITSAYVVVKIWDMRRLIVPLSYFIENNFQNWTRESSEILGTAFLYLDYSVPVEPLRQRLQQIAENAAQWDGKVCGLQVTDLKEQTMELRCLVSSRNASENFDLRCIVREEMMAFVREHYPDSFPKTRYLQGPEEERATSASLPA